VKIAGADIPDNTSVFSSEDGWASRPVDNSTMVRHIYGCFSIAASIASLLACTFNVGGGISVSHTQVPIVEAYREKLLLADSLQALSKNFTKHGYTQLEA